MDSITVLASLLSTTYVATGFVVAASYWPKLRCMLRDPKATAASHSPSSEILWTICRFVSLLYVALVAEQPLIALVVVLDLAGRVASLAIVFRSRRLVKSGRVPAPHQTCDA